VGNHNVQAWEKFMKVRRMWRRRLIVLLGIGALFAGPVPAQADDPLGGTDVLATATSAVDEPVGTVTSTADDVVGTADDVVGSVTSTASGTAGSLVAGTGAGPQTILQGATSSSSTGTSSSDSRGTTSSDGGRPGGSRGDQRTPGRSYHTRFDRLPRRAEVLLERIELGRNVRANLHRLEALLRRSPDLRTEVARALRAEMARLRKGGLTHTERRQLRRLVRLQQVLAPQASGSSATLGSSRSPSPNALAEVESAGASRQSATSQADVAAAPTQRKASESGNGILGTLPLPDGVDGWPSWIRILEDVLLSLCILALVVIFWEPFRHAFR
jgi:hypothetical protein